MLGLGLIVAAVWITGWTVARFLYHRTSSPPPARMELLTAGAIVGVSLWLAASWVLALLHALTARNLIVLAAIFVVSALGSLRKIIPLVRPSTVAIVTIAALAAWSAFILWRAAVVPPANHDVLTYHLPRAVMMARASGFERFPVPDYRINDFPANYELLLSEVLLLQGSDALTELLATTSWIFFLTATGMLVESWWGPGSHVWASILTAAGTPLLLAQSGADKNDLMAGFFALGALFWWARWCVRGEGLAAFLAILCIALLAGTKLNAIFVFAGIAPFVLIAVIRRRPSLGQLFLALLIAGAATLLCGGWVGLQNMTRPAGSTTLEMTASGRTMARYGDWQNLWEVPYLILKVSVGLPGSLPWSGESRPWSKYNAFSSHFGAIFFLMVVASPFTIRRYRGDGQEWTRAERAILSLAALLAFLALLPVEQRPRMLTSSVLRYSVFILPVVIGWTLAPVVRELTVRHRRLSNTLIAALIVVFAQQAVECAVLDTFVPLDYARWAARHPGTRRIHWSDQRAASIVDTMAGPRDTIVIHGGIGAWVHPAYGARLTRSVVMLPQDARSADIPLSAQWVAIDSSGIVGATREAPPIVLELLRDRNFELVHRHRGLGQFVFRRAGAGTGR